MERLTPTDHQTICTYKGRAGYWSAQAGGKSYENVVWSYAAPNPEAEPIRGYFCFYNERMDAIYVDGKLVDPDRKNF
ncbi:MAG: DUF427 domain-containing protein [bacterium]|nr:DUF427 domain-containing protein [bacterium]